MAARGRPHLRFAVLVPLVLLLAPCAGVLLLAHYDSKRANDVFDRLQGIEIGVKKSELLERKIQPDLICPGGLVPAIHRPVGPWPWNKMENQSIRNQLGERTAERWLFFAFGRASPRDHICAPQYLDGELGFDQQDRVIWYAINSGEGEWVYER